MASLELGPNRLNRSSELRGEAALRRLKGLGLSLAQEAQELTSTSAKNLFQLFSFKHPGMVNFELKGLLEGNSLELGIRMGFGPFESQEKRLKLVDIADQFAVVLNALPFVSSKSKDKALKALRDFSKSSVPPPVLTPGTRVALYSKKHRRFLKAGSRDMGSTKTMDVEALRSSWDREYFTVVDGGNGEIALHSARYNRFMRMHSKTNIDMSGARATLPSNWNLERFTPVNAGNGEIALHSKAKRRFVQMHPDGRVRPHHQDRDANNVPGSWERFFVVHTPQPYFYLEPGSVVALYCWKHHRFLRMNNKADMDRSAINGPYVRRGWTWETFTVVDAGGGLIALHSAAHNRFVRMKGNADMRASDKKSINELPDSWTDQRFAVVPAGKHANKHVIALHNPWHNRFVSMTTNSVVASGKKDAQSLPGGWTWQKFQAGGRN